MTSWADLRDVAAVSGVSTQRLRFIVERLAKRSGATWRGASLIVRQVRAPFGGGRSGLRYEVRAASLPPELQEALKARLAPVERPSIEFAEHRAVERDWWLRMLGPLLKLPRGPERASAIATLAAQDNLTDWAGRPIALTDRTIRRRLKQYYDQGAVAFAPRARADKGRPKVIISLKAEQAIPFDTETWEDIASKLRAYIRGHWKENVTYMLIQSRANERFGELLKEAGFDHAHTLPPETLDVPRRFIEAERRYRNVAILHKDRKRFEDNRFRTRRSRESLMPMDWVIGDVHPVDIVMMREDGTTAHARMIAWLDGATNRMRFDLVLCGGDGHSQCSPDPKLLPHAGGPDMGHAEDALYRQWPRVPLRR